MWVALKRASYNVVMTIATRSETILKRVSLGSREPASTFARSALSTVGCDYCRVGTTHPFEPALNCTPVHLNVVGARASDWITKMLTVIYRLVDVTQV